MRIVSMCSLSNVVLAFGGRKNWGCRDLKWIEEGFLLESEIKVILRLIGSMGTKVHCKSYLPVGYSMNDLSNNAKSGSWPPCYEDKSLTAGRRYDHLLQRETIGGYSESDKEELKQAMLKHENIFRNQVYELHRLYRVQKDIMDKLKKKEVPNHQVSVEDTNSRSVPFPILSEGVQNLWRIPQIPLERSWSRPPTSNFNNMHPPLNISKENSMNVSPAPSHNKHSLIDCESKKCPIKKFDLQLPVDEYLACEETENKEQEKGTLVMLPEDNPSSRLSRSASENGSTDTMSKCVLADLNEPVKDEEETTDAPCDGTGGGKNFCSKPNSVFVGLSMEYLQHTWNEREIENHFSGLNCTDVTFAKGKDLNAAIRNNFQLGMSPQQDLVGNEGKNNKDLPTWFRMSQGKEAPKHMEIDFFLGFSQHSTCKVVRSEIATESSVQNSTSHSYESKSVSQMAREGDSAKIHGFPIVNRPHASKGRLSLGFLSNSSPYSSEAVKHFADSNTGQKLSPDSLISCKGFNQYFRDCTLDEMSLSKSITRIKPNINLEVPTDPAILEGISSREDKVDEIIKIAAEAIVIISNSRDQDYSERETLHWFAEVITSPTDDPENDDYFEFMTLKLAETNVEDEYLSKQLIPEYSEEMAVAPWLITQRCRGKGKRGGQQRNFQRDILPSFASLTRHEISDDLEMLEGLVRSMGQSWHIGSAKRNTAKNGKRGSRGSNKK